MAERDPTVIERMAKAFLTSRDSKGALDSPEEAMLTAVRELRDHLGVNSDFHAFRSIEEVITEHERRAGGKGE